MTYRAEKLFSRKAAATTSLWQKNPKATAPIVPPIMATSSLVKPAFYDFTVIWDSERREKPWSAKPTRVQIRGNNLDSIKGAEVRILFSYWAKYIGDRDGDIPISITARTDRVLEFVTDREGFESALTSSKEFFGIVDQAGRTFRPSHPLETRKVAPSNY